MQQQNYNPTALPPSSAWKAFDRITLSGNTTDLEKAVTGAQEALQQRPVSLWLVMGAAKVQRFYLGLCGAESKPLVFNSDNALNA